jgi:hypothetical protein
MRKDETNRPQEIKDFLMKEVKIKFSICFASTQKLVVLMTSEMSFSWCHVQP